MGGKIKKDFCHYYYFEFRLDFFILDETNFNQVFFGFFIELLVADLNFGFGLESLWFSGYYYLEQPFINLIILLYAISYRCLSFDQIVIYYC